MKKIYSILLLTLFTISLKAATYTITIGPGNMYTPSTLTVSVGDVVTINASTVHPVVEVNQTSWNNNNSATLITGFGYNTTNVTFTITTTNTRYYVCKNHVSMGMKGQIVVNAVGINELSENISNISMFPNPAKNKFSINFNAVKNGTLTAKLYSICGQEVEALVANKEFITGATTLTFELQNNIPAGVYFVQLNYNSNKIIKKLIID